MNNNKNKNQSQLKRNQLLPKSHNPNKNPNNNPKNQLLKEKLQETLKRFQLKKSNNPLNNKNKDNSKLQFKVYLLMPSMETLEICSVNVEILSMLK